MDTVERELRIAPVMTGGTSLAVWMGGATAELYRMSRCHPKVETEHQDRATKVYAKLLELTKTKPVIDVITGSSAGGLNGTLLAAARVLNVKSNEFMSIRETWLDVADLELLLRSAKEAHPPSLLKGDDYFLPKVRDKLDDWRRSHDSVGPDAPEVDVVTTVTTVTPEPVARSDDFGEEIYEATHAQCLRFTTEDFRCDGWVEQLAVAARTSACIPGVFEPSFLPVGAKDAEASGRPNFGGGNASFKVSRWAVDGGVVVNLPLTEALDRIFDCKADVDVRRVVLYICPTPSSGSASKADSVKDVPNIRRAATTVVTAPRAEGISADIDLLRRKNRQVRCQEQTRRFIPPWIESHLAGDAKWRTLGVYRHQWTRMSVEAALDRLERALRTPLPDRPAVERTVQRALLDLLPNDFTVSDELPWRWGISPVDQAVSLALRLIHRAQGLVGPSTFYLDKRALRDARRHIHEARGEVREIRKLVDQCWVRQVAELEPTTGTLSTARLVDLVRKSYGLWPDGPPGSVTADLPARLMNAHRKVARTLTEVYRALWSIAAGALTPAPGDEQPGDPPLDPSVMTALAVQDELLNFSAGSGIDPVSVEAVQRRLLEIHVAQSLLLVNVEDREQPVEFMQLSWHSWNALDPDREPDEKLTGPELARLGAFLKPSWRANDWFWGRMDAAHRLVLLLLDASRLKQLGCTRTDVARTLKDLLDIKILPKDLDCELAAYDSNPNPDHTTLHHCARRLTEVVQTVIAQQELEEVANAEEESTARGGNSGASRHFCRAVRRAPRENHVIAASAVGDLVQSMHIGSETVGRELGYALMNRVMSRGAGVAVNALTGRNSGLPILDRVLRPLRTPLQGVNSVVAILTNSSPLARGLTALILAVASVLVGLRIAGTDQPVGAWAVALLLLIGTFVVALLRSGFLWLSICFLVGGSVIGLAVAGKDLPAIVYSEAPPGDGRPLNAGTELKLPTSSVIRVTSGSGTAQRIQDIEVPDGGTVKLQTGDAVTVVPARTDHEIGWKEWGFLKRFSVFRVVLSALLVVAVPGLVRTWRRLGLGGRLARLGSLAIGAAAVVVAPDLFAAAFTGKRDDGTSGEIKRWLVDRAVDFAEYRIPVVLLVLTGVSILLALGTDVAASRGCRQLQVYVVKWWRNRSAALRQYLSS